MPWVLAAIPAGVLWVVCASLGADIFGSDPFAKLASAVPAVWVFWYALDWLHAREYDFLHPQVSKYNLSKKDVFEKLLEYLAERSHRYGRTWIQRTVDDEKKNKIVYDIAWTEEKTDYSFDARGGLRERKKSVKLWVKLHVYIEPLKTGSTAVQITWGYQAEDLPQECRALIAVTTQEIQSLLGPGIAMPAVLQRERLSLDLPAYATTALALCMVITLFGTVFSAHGKRISEAEQALADAKQSYERERESYKKEIEAWQEHKRQSVLTPMPASTTPAVAPSKGFFGDAIP